MLQDHRDRPGGSGPKTLPGADATGDGWGMDQKVTPAVEALVDAVATATRAPSMHNTQPWRFRVSPEAIEVHVDPERVLPVADPTWRAARLACGAALFNLRLALAVQGWSPVVTLMPDHRVATLVARLTFEHARPASPEERALFEAIPRRRSNRYPFLDTPIPLEHRARLRDAAARESAWLDFLLGPAAISMISELAHAADRQLNRNPDYRAEIAGWTRYDGEPCTDGVPEAAGGPVPQPYELLPRRDFGSREPSRRDYETEPLIGVLGSLSDLPVDQLMAGQALQRVLLTATHHGLVASLISQPIEVAEIREQLRIGLGRYGPPQILLRIGYGTPGVSAPRRPASEVVEFV